MMAEQLEDGAIVSRHYYRRTARRKAAKLNEAHSEAHSGAFYSVKPAPHGPYRWYVRRCVCAPILVAEAGGAAPFFGKDAAPLAVGRVGRVGRAVGVVDGAAALAVGRELVGVHIGIEPMLRSAILGRVAIGLSTNNGITPEDALRAIEDLITRKTAA